MEESHDQESNPVVSLFSPQKAYMLKPTSTSLEQSLLSLPFFAQSEIDGLKEELPSYLARAVDVDEQFDSLEWWKLNTISLPRWSAAVRRALLVQPSSAAAERVFSLLKLSFGGQQDNSLQDYRRSGNFRWYKFSPVKFSRGFIFVNKTTRRKMV